MQLHSDGKAFLTKYFIVLPPRKQMDELCNRLQHLHSTAEHPSSRPDLLPGFIGNHG